MHVLFVHSILKGSNGVSIDLSLALTGVCFFYLHILSCFVCLINLSIAVCHYIWTMKIEEQFCLKSCLAA